jgi:hypothetical protein
VRPRFVAYPDLPNSLRRDLLGNSEAKREVGAQRLAEIGVVKPIYLLQQDKQLTPVSVDFGSGSAAGGVEAR